MIKLLTTIRKQIAENIKTELEKNIFVAATRKMVKKSP